jgi:hypothetical protein
VIRRPTGITGGSGNANNNIINLNELQTWVNGVNIMIDNGLTSYFVNFDDKDTIILSTAEAIYNNVIEPDTGLASGSNSTIKVALIIKNIPLTAIDDIQALVLYNRKNTSLGSRTIGLAIELYNSINDPDFTEVLATTNVISTNVTRYRFDFPSIDTYTDFVGEDSITNILNNSFALTEVANVISFPTEITGEVWGGDLSVVGDLTASNKY